MKCWSPKSFFRGLCAVVATASIILFLWGMASFVDVLAHNCSDYAYSVWNLFTLIF